MPPTMGMPGQSLVAPHPLSLRSILSSIPKHAPRAVSLTPTRSISPVSLASLLRRQTVVTITASSASNPIVPAYYSTINSSPPPGEVAGIVFGAVGGFLLLLWLIYTCFSFGTNTFGRSNIVEDVDVRRRSSRPSRHSSHTRSEVIEVSRRSERRSRSRSRSRTPPRRESSRRETIVIEETTRRPAPEPEVEEDVVEVFEEHSPVRRSSKKSSRIEAGFRTVDPEAFGGGDRPYRKVSRRG